MKVYYSVFISFPYFTPENCEMSTGRIKSILTGYKNGCTIQRKTERQRAERTIAPAGLITHRFPFEELNRGLEIMRDKREEYIKIMMLCETV